MKAQTEHKNKSGKVYTKQFLFKLQSELWNDSILVNCLQSQYTVRIKGYAPGSFPYNSILKPSTQLVTMLGKFS